MIRRTLLLISLGLALGVTDASARTDARSADLLRSSYQAEAAGDLDGALQAVRQVTVTEDLRYALTLREAWLLYSAGRHADAVDGYRRAERLATGIEATLGLTLPLMATKRWKETEQACRTVLTAAPGHYTARSRLAWALYSMGRYGDAASEYAALVAQYPSDVDMRTGLGWAQLKQGRPGDALATFRAVLALAPDHPTATDGLAAAGG